MLYSMLDFFLGPCFRSTKNPDCLFLTFDDGPDENCTPDLLNLLKKYNAKATFFLIGNKIEKRLELAKKIIDEGHSVGNHSYDHDTSNFFKSKKHLETWVQKSEDNFKSSLGDISVGFRSPVGIRTPSLNKVLKEKKLKHFLWNIRFYDTKNGFSPNILKKKINKISGGDIILLHDTHHGKDKESFLQGVEILLKFGKENNFKFIGLKDAILG